MDYYPDVPPHWREGTLALADTCRREHLTACHEVAISLWVAPDYQIFAAFTGAPGTMSPLRFFGLPQEAFLPVVVAPRRLLTPHITDYIGPGEVLMRIRVPLNALQEELLRTHSAAGVYIYAWTPHPGRKT